MIRADGGYAGKLVTCDIDPETTETAKRYWSRSPHGKKIELKLGPALETLKTIEGPFDLVLVDNVLWSGIVLKPEDETDRVIVNSTNMSITINVWKL